MNNNPTIPYNILLDKYFEARRDIEYLEYKITGGIYFCSIFSSCLFGMQTNRLGTTNYGTFQRTFV